MEIAIQTLWPQTTAAAPEALPHRHQAHSVAVEKVKPLSQAATASSGVLDAYAKALNTSIDDAFTFMENAMRGTATTPFIARAIAALDHETTTPGRNLASVVDAITLEAQNEDLFTQADMEALAADLLRRGLSQARGERILVEA